jgi:hypothetical protein
VLRGAAVAPWAYSADPLQRTDRQLEAQPVAGGAEWSGVEWKEATWPRAEQSTAGRSRMEYRMAWGMGA